MSNKIYRTASIIIALALTFGTFSSGQAKAKAAAAAPAFFDKPQANIAASVSTFVAEADSRVREASPNANYGADTASMWMATPA